MIAPTITDLKATTLLTAIFYCFICYSQEKQTPEFSRDPGKEKLLIDAIGSQYKKDVASLQGEYKKGIADIYKERYELIKNRFDQNEIITDHKASSYLTSLANEVIKSNNVLNSADIRVVFSRSWWPNASSMGEGTILFNIGLFHRLQNESQAIFVICHELAHYYLDHVNKTLSNI